MKEHYVFGDYVVTGVTNAFNNMVSWWITKKDCAVACYCFSTEHTYRSGPPSPTEADNLILSKIKDVFGAEKSYNIVRWETHYEREEGLSNLAHTNLSLEDALSVFTDEYTQYPCVEVQTGDTALCIGGTEADVAVPEWLCLELLDIPYEGCIADKELAVQLKNINAYISMYEERMTRLHSPKPYRIFITEENINGCGDYANTAAEFNRKLSKEEGDAFSALLTAIKKEANEKDECLDTDDMLQEALNRFEATAKGKIIPVADAYISF
ncbi:MAG: hypothetical protein IJA20_02940 [Methanocorpusculum sp.]|nr:hypothetical protein [Oscillospiraceae bacterium]MBQ3569612.1 hypothetical protein [Methanocorpusculum sp.]